MRFSIQPISMRVVIEDLELAQADNQITRLMSDNGLYRCGRVDLSTQETRTLFQLWPEVYDMCVKEDGDDGGNKEVTAKSIGDEKENGKPARDEGGGGGGGGGKDQQHQHNDCPNEEGCVANLPPLIIDLLPKNRIMLEKADRHPQAMCNVDSCVSFVMRWRRGEEGGTTTQFRSLSIVRRRYCSKRGSARETASVIIATKMELEKFSKIVLQLNEMDKILFPSRAGVLDQI
ncbi:MAG TPA: hypothetical protein VMZ26_09355 [Pyrinomonadaceae bacterium]|nr:hypothetical protein [Pyrinomonadaceae bacterium]